MREHWAASQPVSQAELLGRPLQLLAAVDSDDAEAPSLGAHRGNPTSPPSLATWHWRGSLNLPANGS